MTELRQMFSETINDPDQMHKINQNQTYSNGWTAHECNHSDVNLTLPQIYQSPPLPFNMYTVPLK